jgi:glutamate racemase
MGCELVILACNTASAKALRNIQQKDLPNIDPNKRVLGVLRPTTEVIGNYTSTNNIGVLGTKGTVLSNSYEIEINKAFPAVLVTQEACPMWVPLVENNEFNNEGADYFIKKNIDSLLTNNNKIDTIILACTHYPLLIDKIKQFLPDDIKLLSQGEIVANSLSDYLIRHPQIDEMCSKNRNIDFYTTDSVENFNTRAADFFGKTVNAKHIEL